MVLKIETSAPIYKHDCKECTYHLSVVDSNGTIQDIYTCTDKGITKAIILRTGNEEQENLSYEFS